MYESFYSLTRQPFGKNLKNSEAYRSISVAEAEARLKYLLKTRGVALITGEPGSGKTFTLRCFTDTLSTSLYKVIYFPLSTGTVMDFYRGLAYGLGETPRQRGNCTYCSRGGWAIMQILAYEADSDRWHVYNGDEYYCPVHCGECFGLKVEGRYIPVRMEPGNDWYVILDIYKIVLNPRLKYDISMP